MKELYIEGLANHDDHESCAGIRKETGEALTVAHTGEAIEPRNADIWSADAFMVSGRRNHMNRKARNMELHGVVDPDRIGNLSTYGNSLHGNRESPWLTLETRSTLGIQIGVIQR